MVPDGPQKLELSIQFPRKESKFKIKKHIFRIKFEELNSIFQFLTNRFFHRTTPLRTFGYQDNTICTSKVFRPISGNSRKDEQQNFEINSEPLPSRTNNKRKSEVL